MYRTEQQYRRVLLIEWNGNTVQQMVIGGDTYLADHMLGYGAEYLGMSANGAYDAYGSEWQPHPETPVNDTAMTVLRALDITTDYDLYSTVMISGHMSRHLLDDELIALQSLCRIVRNDPRMTTHDIRARLTWYEQLRLLTI